VVVAADAPVLIPIKSTIAAINPQKSLFFIVNLLVGLALQTGKNVPDRSMA
jgi:hypothetical protein